MARVEHTRKARLTLRCFTMTLRHTHHGVFTDCLMFDQYDSSRRGQFTINQHNGILVDATKENIHIVPAKPKHKICALDRPMFCTRIEHCRCLLVGIIVPVYLKSVVRRHVSHTKAAILRTITELISPFSSIICSLTITRSTRTKTACCRAFLRRTTIHDGRTAVER